MTQVLRLAVAAVEPGKDAENLGRPLRRERCVKLGEGGGVEALILEARTHVAAEQRHFQRFRDVDARVLQQRGHVVGGRTEQRVLEIKEPDPGDVFALRQPQQIGRMIIAQHPGGGRIDRRLRALAATVQ